MNKFLIFAAILAGLWGLCALIEWAFERWLSRLIRKHSRPNRVHFEWSVGPVQNKTKEAKTMKVTINNLQKITLTLTPVNDAGQPAPLDGKPTWTQTR